MIVDGSSPRTRGTHGSQTATTPSVRFIPAYAGNSAAQCYECDIYAVHPRVRGELRLALKGDFADIGSSPRTRGTRSADTRRSPRCRFIPAYAGNSRSSVERSRPIAVHPRVRGELVSAPIDSPPVIGSSPRTRGTQINQIASKGGNRFIPAYAGNSWTANGAGQRRTVHPRVRGELRSPAGKGQGNRGSSPRTRGTPNACRVVAFGKRFIPAYAGNSVGQDGHASAVAVHPRVRGELTITSSPIDGSAGSSPRTRGTHLPGRAEPNDPRFIPAYAGNSVPPHRIRVCSPVHPRVRGELNHFVNVTAVNLGSSPRTRGTRPPAITCRIHVTVHPRVRGELTFVTTHTHKTTGSSPRTRGTPVSTFRIAS